MKYIQKHAAPPEYTDWCRQVRGTAHEDYRQLANPVKGVLHAALMADQGWLCAYTMRRIGAKTSHIEHIKPETLCRQHCRGADLEYGNLVACFPLAGMKAKYRYGAQLKDDWWEADGGEFVSPLHNACEHRFRFDIDGRIAAVGNSTAAVTTIRVLGLDHHSLTEDRKRVIREFIYGPDGDAPLSRAEAERSIEVVCAIRPDGMLNEFCVALRDALHDHLRKLDQLAAKRRFAGEAR